SPIPSGVHLNSVDMLSSTEGWAAGQRGVILHTTDGGSTWAQQNSGVGSEPVYDIRFIDSMHGLAGSTNTVLYTSDGGQTWGRGSGAVGSIYQVEMASVNRGFATYGYEGMYVTRDGGRTWQHRDMPSAIGRVQCFDAQNCIANSPSGVYHSYDGGNNWSLTAGHGGSYFINHNQGWRVIEGSTERTLDGGASWQSGTLPAGAWIYDAMFVDAQNGWATGDSNRIYRTTDGGMTWDTQFGQDPYPYFLPMWGVDFVDAQHGVVVGNDGLMLVTWNGGQTWTNIQSGTGEHLERIVANDAMHVWAAGNGGHVLYTTDGGQYWHRSRPATSGTIKDIDFPTNTTGWAVSGPGFVAKSTDGGRNWTRQDAQTSQYLYGVDALNEQTIVIVGGGTMYTEAKRSTDGGQTWTGLQVGIGDALFLDVFFVNETTGWIVGNQGGISKSTDGGATWSGRRIGNWGFNNVHFSDPNNGWAGGYFADLYHTTDGGETWVQQNPQIPDRTHVLGVSAISPSVAWISGYGGGAESRPYVKRTTDGGNTWIADTPVVGPYDSLASVAFLDADNGWVAGAFGQIFRHRPEGSITPSPTRTPVSATSTVPPTATHPPVSTNTPVGTAMPSLTAVPATGTSVPSITATSQASSTATSVASTATPIVCVIRFDDVPSSHAFYQYVTCLACGGVMGGYSDGTFRPNNDITRGQIAKVVSNAAGFNENPGAQIYEDVPSTNTFYAWINRLSMRGVMGGYPCGTVPTEPCGTPSKPYFRPNDNATRGQLAKIVASANGITGTPTGQRYEDVAPDDTFYGWIEQLSGLGVMGGYPCGVAGELCGSDNKPYFRPSNNVTRGQASKIVANTFFPNCSTSGR
ncbi:MAG TPA: YCF48-related protein, partial [Chloroflexia bacterium]|nr:YCF48-related protein [Chloroflexia bacterium]